MGNEGPKYKIKKIIKSLKYMENEGSKYKKSPKANF
jgi:hypothetical protein